MQAVKRGRDPFGRFSPLPRPHNEINEVVQHVHNDRSGRRFRNLLVGAGERPARRRHRADKCGHTLVLLASNHRFPAGVIGAVLLPETRQQLLSRHQRPGKSGHPNPVG